MGVEGVGEAVTGGLAARAVEPPAGEPVFAAPATCLNCGATLVGDYCHRCGQSAHVHRSLSAWWHDFLHSVVHLDGKFWRTLPMLAWRPGELTRAYIEGQRARFVSPLALFLFSVFLMFAVFSLGGATGVAFDPGPQAQADLDAELSTLRAEASRVDARLAGAAAPERRALVARRDALRSEIEQVELAGTLVTDPSRLPLNVETGWERLDKGVRKAGENPALLFYKVQANAYKFSWALIPISVPFVWLLFLHRGRYRREHGAFDHLVFVTYSIAFMSLWAIAWFLVQSAGLTVGVVDLVFLLVPPVHLFRQLKQAYGLSGFGALWRTAALLVFASVSLALFLLLLLGLGLLG